MTRPTHIVVPTMQCWTKEHWDERSDKIVIILKQTDTIRYDEIVCRELTPCYILLKIKGFSYCMYSLSCGADHVIALVAAKAPSVVSGRLLRRPDETSDVPSSP